VPSSARDGFRADLGLVQAAITAGVVSSRSDAALRTWRLWVSFCVSLDLDPGLANIPDPVPFLQVFVQRYRDGRIAPSSRAVRARTVEDAARHIGQTFAGMGAPDPRLNTFGRLDFRIQRQLSGYHKTDPPPSRVKPIPLAIIYQVIATVQAFPSQAAATISDMIIIAFYFLLRPGEYTGTKQDTTCFRLANVQLWQGGHRLDLANTTDHQLLAATFVSLTFTNQKNGVRGEVIGHSRSGSPICCPVLALVRRILHLRHHSSPPATPLATYYTNNIANPVRPADITDALRQATALVGPSIGFLPNDISASSLRAGGAMALLCASVDSDRIRLLGRWRSDEMLRYLHLQAQPVMRHFASKMLFGGNYSLIPGQDVPAFLADNPQVP
jgi:hypothetical protein